MHSVDLELLVTIVTRKVLNVPTVMMKKNCPCPSDPVFWPEISDQ